MLFELASWKKTKFTFCSGEFKEELWGGAEGEGKQRRERSHSASLCSSVYIPWGAAVQPQEITDPLLSDGVTRANSADWTP